jgi:hypothetical protein
MICVSAQDQRGRACEARLFIYLQSSSFSAGPQMLNRFVLSLVFLSVIGIAACDTLSPPPQSTPPKPQPVAPTTQELTADQIQGCIHGGSDTLARSPAFKMSGDIRPLWIITGKVQNDCAYDLKTVTIRAIIYSKGHLGDTLDTADFTVDNVPAHNVRGYRQEIQLMAERTQQFDFYYDFVAATAQPKTLSN